MSAVTREEAREILGLASDATDEEARRAYTRLVKQHKPDRDPEGFRRVREAYECLRRVEPTSAAPLPTAPVAPSETPVAAAHVVIEDPALAKARKKLRAVLRDTPTVAVPGVLAEHLARHPSDDEVRFDAVRALASAWRFQDANAMLEGGVRDGGDPRPFLVQLALWSPDAIDDARLEQLRADRETEPYAAVVLVARGRLEQAERLTTDALARDATLGRARRATWQRVVAGLFAWGGISLARATLARLDPLAPSDALAPEQVLQAILLAELEGIADDIEVPLARVLGTFIGSQMHAHAAIRWNPGLYTRHVKTIAAVERRAPQLMGLTFPPSLRRGVASRRDGRIVLSIFGMMFALVVGLSFYDQMIDHEPFERSAPTQAICEERGERDDACGRARTVDYFLELGNCPSARNVVRSLDYVRDASASTLQQIDRQTERVTDLCGSRR